MGDIKSSNQRSILMELLKTKLGGFLIWQKIEEELTLLVSKIPELTNDEKKLELINCLKDIKTFLINKDVNPDQLDFLDDEIEKYNHTRQITLWQEKDDFVSPEDIDLYSRASADVEGIVGIDLNYNYEQLKKLTNGVYAKTKLVKFFISSEKTIYGKIVAEIYEHPYDISIATLAQSKPTKNEGEPLKFKIFLFGSPPSKQRWDKLKEIQAPFWVYKFVTQFNQELFLLSKDKLEISDYSVTGVTLQVDDFKTLTESTRLPTKLPYMFVQSVKNRIIKFKNHDEFKKRLGQLEVNKTNLFDVPFSIKLINEETGLKENKILRHPEWFKYLIWSWLTHATIGMDNKYPLHLLIAGPADSGKSYLLNLLHSRSKEFNSIFSGSSSTAKRLVPSFKKIPAEQGYLADSNRFSFCDEFFRAFIRTRSGTSDNQREETVAMMNDLLEHQKREAGSGVSKISGVKMTSRVIATTNPIREVNNVEDIITHFDKSFLSRWMIYWQSKEHVNMIKDADSTTLKNQTYEMENNDWISLLDYLQTFRIKVDLEKLNEIYKEPMEILTSDLKEHYLSRHKHHIRCILDGIVKTRCLFERDMGFGAQDKDYEMLRVIWANLIRSWMNPESIRAIPVERRILYMPEKAQYLFKKLCNTKKIIKRYDFEELALKGMTKNEYITAVILLRDNGLIVEDDGDVRPHYMVKGEEQQKLED